MGGTAETDPAASAEAAAAGGAARRRMLLHSCCGPCSTHCIRALRAGGVEPVVFYSNSNIDTRGEWERRLAALRTLCESEGVELRVDPYEPESWRAATRGLESEAEGGRRCDACFAHNLGRAAKEAAKSGLPAFTTSLTVSPHKNSARVFAAGRAAAASASATPGATPAPAFEEWNFKKRGGFAESLRLSRELGLYRQDYCGCAKSHADSLKRRAASSCQKPPSGAPGHQNQQ